MRYFLFLILVCGNSWALDAVITVLEAPLFEKRDLNSRVVQYKRRGDIIKVHPSLNNSDKYNNFAPSPRKQKELREKLEKSPEFNEDPLFRGLEANTHSIDDEFIPTLDRQGKEVWVLTRHVYVYFNNEKEFTQVPFRKDETDYRLDEPLPENYPLKTSTGYRGLFTMGITQPYYESYPYLASVRTKGYSSPVDLNLAFMRKVPTDTQDRFFFGINFNLKFFENNYTLADGKKASEEGIKFGLGPYITYDAFKGKKDRVNLFGVVNVYLFNQLTIDMKDQDQVDQRKYRAYSFAPRLGVQYHRKKIINDLDFVLGTSIEAEPSSTFRSTEAASQVGWWRKGGNDSFSPSTTFSLAGFIGLQQAY